MQLAQSRQTPPDPPATNLTHTTHQQQQAQAEVLSAKPFKNFEQMTGQSSVSKVTSDHETDRHCIHAHAYVPRSRLLCRAELHPPVPVCVPEAVRVRARARARVRACPCPCMPRARAHRLHTISTLTNTHNPPHTRACEHFQAQGGISRKFETSEVGEPPLDSG